MIIENNSKLIKEIRDKFLTMDAEGKIPIDPVLFKRKNIVYMIVNLKTGKKYVGKTTNLLNRANNYILHYRTGGTPSRYLLVDMKRYGIENFRMFPIAFCESREQMAADEGYYVKAYNTLVPNGYNMEMPSKDSYQSKHDLGHPHSVATKMKKAKLIAAVDPENKKMYISVGMKLFGDFVGKTKDVIKNAAKVPNRICGYYVIYLNEDDQNQVLEKVQKRVEEMYNRSDARNRDKSNHEEYFKVVSDVKTMILEDSVDVYTEQDYQCKFITYATEQESSIDTSYRLAPIEEFLSIISQNKLEN